MAGSRLFALCSVHCWAAAVEQTDNADLVQLHVVSGGSDYEYDQDYYEPSTEDATETVTLPETTAISAWNNVYNGEVCKNQVLGNYRPRSQQYHLAKQQIEGLIATKNLGIWLYVDDLDDVTRFCERNPLEAGRTACLQEIAPISTAGVSYCDEYCQGAIDDLQKIYSDHGVCKDWALDARALFAGPYDHLDCPVMVPVQDNSDIYPERADPIAKCEACVESDCTGKTTISKRAGGNPYGANANDMRALTVEHIESNIWEGREDIDKPPKRTYIVPQIDVDEYAQRVDHSLKHTRQ